MKEQKQQFNMPLRKKKLTVTQEKKTRFSCV